MKIKHIEAVKKAVVRFAKSPRKLFLVAIIPVLLVSLWLARPAKALVTYQNNSTGENVTGATTLSINMPTLLSAGDVVIAVITVKGGTGITITPPNTMLVAALGSGTNTTFTAGSSMTLRGSATNPGEGGSPAPTVDQKLRGGQSVQTGVKAPFDM